MKVYVYIMSASTDPDVCERSVPFAINDQEIFFGPCKKNLRSELRRQLLDGGAAAAVPDSDIYLVGLNGTNDRRVRKIIWAGRIKKVMTFAEAWDALVDADYRSMREDPATPLHMEPIREKGELVGYRHVGTLHQNDWILDVVGRRKSAKYEVDEQTVRLAGDASASAAFTRDTCMLLENTFTAVGAGVPVDDEILKILQEAQTSGPIDDFAVFGYQKNGAVEGRSGRWLLLEGDLATRFMKYLRSRIDALRSQQRPIGELKTTQSCRCDPGERDEDPDDRSC